jgi:hypothetical protein
MNGFRDVLCSCLNPQSCRCHASQPAHHQGEYHPGYPQLSTLSRAHIAMPSSHSPFTPRSRGLMQRHYTGAYNSQPSYNPITFYDNHHTRNTNNSTMYTFPSPHRNIIPNLSPMHPRGHQQPSLQQVPGHLPLPPVALNMHLVPSAQTQAGANKRKAAAPVAALGRKPRAKRPRVPASLDTGPVAASCGVGPSVPESNDGPVSVTSSQVLPVAVPSVPILSESSSTSLPTASYPSLSQNRRPMTKQNTATDCWYFVRAIESDVQPTDPPSASGPVLMEKPCTSHISCKLCS